MQETASGIAQLNVKIDAGVKIQFVEYCDRRHQSQAEVVERLITAAITAGDCGKVTHLDGEICPLSKMIIDIADAVKSQLATSGYALKLGQ